MIRRYNSRSPTPTSCIFSGWHAEVCFANPTRIGWAAICVFCTPLIDFATYPIITALQPAFFFGACVGHMLDSRPALLPRHRVWESISSAFFCWCFRFEARRNLRFVFEELALLETATKRLALILCDAWETTIDALLQ